MKKIFERLQGKASNEPERLFLIARSDVPELTDKNSELITQVYLSNKGRVRSYEKPNGSVRFDAAIKTEDTQNPGSKIEAEDQITQDEFVQCVTAETARMIKTRYYFYEDEAIKIFIDRIDQGPYAGLFLLEVEGKSSQEELNTFTPESWFGEEITGKLTNFQIATNTVAQEIEIKIRAALSG